MEFKLEEDINCKITLIVNGIEKGTATCYIENTPEIDGKSIGCIGDFEACDKESGVALLNKCEEYLKDKGFSYIVAPMNGNTWKKYRTMKWTSGDDLFLLENVNPIEDNEILLDAGFEELHTYTSNKGLIEDAYKSEVLDLARENIKEHGITIRKFDKSKAVDELKKIYNVSRESFARNPLYTPIDSDNFIKQYTDYIEMVDEDFILLAEKDGKEIGFVFCVPNFIELKMGKPLTTLILKTIAVLPEYEDLAIGNVLLDNIANKAEEKNFKEWIFAFMYKNNTSQKMAKRNNAKPIREYAIYGKKI